MHKQVILYFSNTGHTQAVAQKIAAVTGAKLLQLNAKQPYTDADLDYDDATSRTSLETADETSRPAIQTPDMTALREADTIYLGSPLWWGQVPHVINTLVETDVLRGKRVWQFCTSGSTAITKAAKTLRADYPAVRWEPAHRFTSTITGQEVEAWLKESGH